MKQGLWIPKEIMQLSDVTLLEKMILSSVLNFSRKTGMCSARNSTIAESLNISIKSTECAVARLIKKGYLQSTGRGRNRDLTIHSNTVNNSLKMSELNTQNEGVIHSNTVNNSLKMSEFPKEDKREDKREDKGEIMSLRDNPPHGDLINGGLKNDQERDEADTEQLLSDFWKQELGL